MFNDRDGGKCNAIGRVRLMFPLYFLKQLAFGLDFLHGFVL